MKTIIFHFEHQTIGLPQEVQKLLKLQILLEKRQNNDIDFQVEEVGKKGKQIKIGVNEFE